MERRIERLIASGELDRSPASPDEIGRARRIDDAAGRYVVFLKKTLPIDLTLDGLRVVLDCANGAAYQVGPTVLEELGAEVFRLGVEPNGRNINDGCGSLHPEKTAARVREVRADIGIALDGDADRCVLVDDKGDVVDGDAVLALCATHLVERGALKGGAVVATVMSNLGLEKHLESLGLRLIRTQVGDRYVVEAMRAGGYNLGGEQSGHVIFLDHNTTGDGLITALQTLAILRRSGRKLSDLVASFTRYPQVLVNLRVAQKRPLESLPEMMDLVRKVEAELDGFGRVLIRYSGTEPKARIMVEGQDEGRVAAMAADLAACLGRCLGRAD
jgi:phosphoglucosamine mutase